MNRHRVLIVDDQQLFAETLKRALVFEEFTRVAYETSASEPEIMKMVGEFRPGVILMDIHLKHLDGFTISEKILKLYPDIIILMLTAFGYDDYVQKAMNIGASGILLKDVSMDELTRAITNASKDNFIISKITSKGGGSKRSKKRPKWVDHLSQRDIHILRLISQGYSNDEIAKEMNLGKQTVKNYISRIYGEMKVNNRFQAIRTILEVFPEYSSHQNLI